ncbi:hypothetical protein [Sinomonas soli]
MSAEEDARRIASGPLPSELVGGAAGAAAHDGERRASSAAAPPEGAGGGEDQAPFDPLRLCIFATIALLGWLAGPVALVVFAAVGFAGYWRARRAGLTRSKCYLRDTRLVLAYLAVLTAAGLWGIYSLLTRGGLL